MLTRSWTTFLYDSNYAAEYTQKVNLRKIKVNSKKTRKVHRDGKNKGHNPSSLSGKSSIVVIIEWDEILSV